MTKYFLLTFFALLSVRQLSAQDTLQIDSTKYLDEAIIINQANKRTPVAFRNIYSKDIKQKSTIPESSFSLSETSSITNYFDGSAISKVDRQNVSIDSTKKSKNIKFKYKSLIIPTALIGYGVVGLTNPYLKDINISAKNDLRGYDDKELNIDDYSQYSPFLSVYALNAMGIHGKHNFKDRTMVLATAYLIMGGSVNVLKRITKVTRPDGSSATSFPSGHTATVFMGAEFLYQEYKDISVWYGITGYVVAAGTGLFRIYNDKHWFTDVATGAGIGILSTKIAYWVHPLIKNVIFKDKEKTTGIVMPFYNGREYGLGLSLRF